MNPILVILGGGKLRQQFNIEVSKPFTIGRDSKCGMTIPEKRVSREHCKITWYADSDMILIEDLNSLNGTFVNGNQIKGLVPLKHKDSIQVGSWLFSFQNREMTDSETSSQDFSVEEQTPLPLHDQISEKSDDEIKQIEEKISDDQNVTGGRLLSGKLDEIPLPDILQFLELTEKSGHLVISKKKVFFPPAPENDALVSYGSMYIQKGQIVAAKYHEKSNEEAFFELLHWSKGYFSLFPRLDFDFDPRIDVPLKALLFDGIRRLDEERAQRFQPSNLFKVNKDTPLRSLKPEHLEVFQLVWKHKQFEKILENTDLDQETVKNILENLIELKYVTEGDS